jgi:hypothetical protein
VIETLIYFVLYLVVLGAIAGLLLYIVGIAPIPEPFKQWAKVFVLIICCLIMIVLLLNVLGLGGRLALR